MRALAAMLCAVIGVFGSYEAWADALPPHDDNLIRYEACLFNVTDQAFVDIGPETVFDRADELCAHYFEKYKQGPVASYLSRYGSLIDENWADKQLSKDRERVKSNFLNTFSLIKSAPSKKKVH
ncbi:MAG: hypothetical protein AAF221_03825 [Pseudomonadota bacterium]